jgi:tetratricopeptide (TPR) repeat protein
MRIDGIRGKFGISLEAISRYRKEHSAEIQNIADMFFLKNGDREKVLVLLYLFSAGEKDEAVQRYCGQTGLNDGSGPVDKYKTMLVAALVYNPAFFAMAWNYREAVRAGLEVGEIDKKIFPVQGGNEKSSIIPFPLVSRFSNKTVRITAAAAAGFVVCLFVALLVRVLTGAMGPKIDNGWIAGLKEPLKGQDGTAYFSTGGAYIELLSPLMGIAMGTDSKAGSDQTIKYYTREIGRNRNDSSLYVNRGVAYTVHGYLDSAIKDFDRAIELDPGNASAYYNRAIAAFGKGNTAAAIANLETAIGINPEEKEFRYTMGTVYYRQYENEETRPDHLLLNSISAFEHIRGYKDTDIILAYLDRMYGGDGR